MSAGKGGGGGVRNPCTLPLDPPLFLTYMTALLAGM